MLRIEAYPVLDGLAVNFIGVPVTRIPDAEGDRAARVHRTIPSETIENLGLDEAFREVVMDVLILYPGMLHHALQ